MPFPVTTNGSDNYFVSKSPTKIPIIKTKQPSLDTKVNFDPSVCVSPSPHKRLKKKSNKMAEVVPVTTKEKGTQIKPDQLELFSQSNEYQVLNEIYFPAGCMIPRDMQF